MSLLIEPAGRTGLKVLFHFVTKRTLASKPTTEKTLKAKTMKNVYRQNKDLFGELVESKKEKIKRVKKEAKLAKKYQIENADETELLVEGKINSISSGPALNYLNKTEKNFNIEKNEDFPGSQESILSSKDKTKINRYDKKAEANWNLRNFPTRTKLLNRSSPGSETIIETYMEKGGLSKVQIVPNTLSQNIYKNEKISSPSIKQFMTGLYDFPEFTPYSEVKIFKNKKDQDETELNEKFNDSEDLLELEAKLSISTEQNCKDVEPENNDLINIKVEDETHSSLNLNSTIYPIDNPNRSLLTTDHVESSFFDSTNESIMTLPYKHLYPSVSKILNATMPPEQAEALARWEKKMEEKLGEEGFHIYKTNLLKNGKDLHKSIQDLLTGNIKINELNISEENAGHWKSISPILPRITKVVAIESSVQHPLLQYSGIIDFVGIIEDKLIALDWKTSEKLKPTISQTYDAPLQLSAYIGAINYDPNYSFKVNEGLIIVAYKDGRRCEAFSLNEDQLEAYWKNRWLKRLREFKKNNVQMQNI